LFTARILLILNAPISAQAAAETITRALKTSIRPIGLCFALPHSLEDQMIQLPDGVQLIYYDAAQGLTGVVPVLQNETHFLSFSGPHAFCEHWDSKLYALYRRYGRQTLFTGSLTPCAPSGTTAPEPGIRRLNALRKSLPALRSRNAQPDESVGILRHLPKTPAQEPSAPEACLPALKEALADNTALIGRGLALVCAEAPVRTMLIDPSLLFGPIAFLRDGNQLTADTLSMAAYLKGYTIYALHEALLWPLSSPPRQVLQLPSPDILPGTTLARFEQLLGFYSSDRVCSAKAAMGLFGHEDTYSQRTPRNLIWSQKALSARMKLLEINMPLMVSASIDLPNPRVTSAFYLLRFGFLRRIASLPLVLYTGGSQERALRAAFPNTHSYPDGTLLPRTLLQQGMKPEEHFARSKTLLMKHAAKLQVAFTHAAWLDMDVLPHPVCTDAVPNFSSMMDDRIHIATVNGVPDPSFIVVPVEYLSPLAKLVESITLLDAELQRGFSDALLWERIFQKKPAWFAIHRMPRRRMLFLSAFEPQLLSQSLRSALANLPEPYYASQADVPAKAKPEKEPSLNV